MGDTDRLHRGSLGSISIMCKQEILLAIIGGLFVLETFSVVIQVLIFKISGKSIPYGSFTSSFEKGLGRINHCYTFLIITIVLALIGLEL